MNSKTALDRLYATSTIRIRPTDPIQIVRRFERPDDREVVGFCAAALAFGRVASVLQSIERLLADHGDRAGRLRAGAFDPDARERRHSPASSIAGSAGPDLVALLWLLKQMLDRSGSIEGFFVEGYDASADDVGPALDSFSTRALALDLRAAYGRVPGAARRLLLLSAAVGRQRLQAAEPVPALDGAARRAGSRRLVACVAAPSSSCRSTRTSSASAAACG